MIGGRNFESDKKIQKDECTDAATAICDCHRMVGTQ